MRPILLLLLDVVSTTRVVVVVTDVSSRAAVLELGAATPASPLFRARRRRSFGANVASGITALS